MLLAFALSLAAEPAATIVEPGVDLESEDTVARGVASRPAARAALDPCASYDAALTTARSTFCASGFCTASANATAKHDWPSQVTYMHGVITALTADPRCSNTSIALDTLAFLNENQTVMSNPSSFGNTWLIFQVQYYDMPRRSGVRIEAPDTLGRKCWAFAYLDQIVAGDLVAIAPHAPKLAALWTEAVPLTLNLCEEVMANCFLNASYDPQRNGSCPAKIMDFHLAGFERENALRGFSVTYRFR